MRIFISSEATHDGSAYLAEILHAPLPPEAVEIEVTANYE